MDSYNFEIFKGSSFSLGITLKDGDGVPIDLTNYNVSGFLRYQYSSASKLISLGVQKESPQTSGLISLNVPSTGTQNLPVTLGVYDIEIYHTGLNTTDKVLKGTVSILPEATY